MTKRLLFVCMLPACTSFQDFKLGALPGRDAAMHDAAMPDAAIDAAHPDGEDDEETDQQDEQENR